MPDAFKLLKEVTFTSRVMIFPLPSMVSLFCACAAVAINNPVAATIRILLILIGLSFLAINNEVFRITNVNSFRLLACHLKLRAVETERGVVRPMNYSKTSWFAIQLLDKFTSILNERNI